MKSSRRHFLHSTGLFLAASTLGEQVLASEIPLDLEAEPQTSLLGRSSLTQMPSPKISWPILQGPTDHRSSTLIILHPKTNFSIKVLGPKNEVLPTTIVETWNLPNSTLATTEVLVKGLKVGLDYRLYLLNPDGKYFELRYFSALNTSKKRCSFAVVSCMADLYRGEAKTMWEALANQECDFVLFAGDTCYSDNDNPQTAEHHYARRYAETRKMLYWFRQPRLTPSFATWDDHDFGLNNADRTFLYGGFNRKLFRRFWGSTENSAWRKAHGVGSVLEAYGQRFYLLDDRSFRDPVGTKNGRHLGKTQTDWLLEDLAKSAKPSWLINGSQFFGGYLAKESFESDHDGDFKDFLRRLSHIAAPVGFISGDVHFSEVMRIEPEQLGYLTYEFTSSSMHSFTHPFPGGFRKNPRRLVSEWRHNFIVFISDVNEGWKIRTQCVRDFSRASFDGTFEINRNHTTPAETETVTAAQFDEAS